MAFDTLHALLVDGLQDLHSAETQLVRALPAMELAAQNTRLKMAFANHLEQTRQHVIRLETALRLLHEPELGKRCRAMEGLIEEGNAIAGDTGSYVVRDAGLIAAAQRVEHFEIAAYGSALAFARLLEYDAIATLLSETLVDEKSADGLLSALADSEVNLSAKSLFATREGPPALGGLDTDAEGRAVAGDVLILDVVFDREGR